ncbi:hypothetical protein LZ31DRAFT_86502 [Colletotrichum somersetense]|nr:hypothetical protein LZ31DRAFT_86502 [Colletotrichum somersetense]
MINDAYCATHCEPFHLSRNQLCSLCRSSQISFVSRRSHLAIPIYVLGTLAFCWSIHQPTRLSIMEQPQRRTTQSGPVIFTETPI